MALNRIVDGYLLEQVINHALALDSELALKLAELEGKTISIQLNIRERPWVLQVRQGRLLVLDTHDEVCDVRLRGSLSAFLQLFGNQSSQGRQPLYIEGDLHAAQQFQRVMADIQPDFDGALRQRFGDRLGGLLADGLQQIREKGSEAQAECLRALQAFLSDDEGQCLGRATYDGFVGRLERLRHDLQRLEARVALLERV